MQSEAAVAAVDAKRVWSDVEALATITEPDRPYTRRSFSPRYLEGRAWLAERMRAAGLDTRIDAAGNLIGRQPGRRAGARAIVLGSHTDTVPSGGRFDGIAGVVAALEVARALAESGVGLASPFEVVDFLAEEPSTFGVSCVGSRAMAAALDASTLAATDASGETLAAAIGRMGGDVRRLDEARREDIAAFLELHIEQGPVLEAAHVDVGIVTGIAGIARIGLAFEGEAAHAGTMPMHMRHDASAAGAEALLWVRDRARSLAGSGADYFVATTGIAELQPNASNVVPRAMRLVIDARSAQRAALERFVDELRQQAQQIAARNRVALARCEVLSDCPPAQCDARLRRLLDDRAAALGFSSLALASGAGHDAAFLTRIAPSAMVFIPCRGGRSHCPEEWAEAEAIARGTRLLCDAVIAIDRKLAREDLAAPLAA